MERNSLLLFRKSHRIFWVFLRGLIFTIFTLGIYGAWFQVSLRKYVMSHLRLGNVSFNFKGQGKTLFWLNFKFFLFFYPTLGIYTFWYVKNLWTYYASNTEVTLNEEKQNFSFTAQTGDIFELLLVNSLLLICTLGLALPWVVIRTNTFIFKFLALENFDSKKIQKASYDNYDDATGEAALDMLDFNLI
ncbi:hypothetical protein BSU00_10135 [Tenacibaculum sp. SG-28]|nr:hypothetical protein BSU00_10135 [Tenacibaculum sp. SG-28]